MAKRHISNRQAKEMLPVIKDFNALAKQLLKLLGMKAEQQERRINVMVSRISRPGAPDRKIDVRSVEFTGKFLQQQRKKRRGQEWDDSFSQKRGFVI